MELILINENKLKIMMSENDMHKFGLDENEFYLSVSNTRAILSKILHEANIRTGFENLTPEDKILIQLYPEVRGGCELYITKITIGDTSFKEEESLMPQGDEKYLLPKSTKKVTEHKKIPITYSFNKLDYVIAACKELIKRSFSGESSLCYLDDGKYLLFIIEEDTINTPINCLSEFGQLENTENSYLRSLERGTSIIHQNAVEKISTI
ncbi:MAG: adaptor protein MecA [Clostridia bacterium]|nr:adaptor protein MecA [Clostridia bacterium]